MSKLKYPASKLEGYKNYLYRFSSNRNNDFVVRCIGVVLKFPFVPDRY